MKYVVDEIIDSVARIENSTTGEMKDVSLQELPSSVAEGNVLIWNDENSCFSLAANLEEERRKRIKAKLARVKKIKAERDEVYEKD